MLLFFSVLVFIVVILIFFEILFVIIIKNLGIKGWVLFSGFLRNNLVFVSFKVWLVNVVFWMYFMLLIVVFIFLMV